MEESKQLVVYWAKVLTQHVNGQNFIRPISEVQFMLEKLLN